MRPDARSPGATRFAPSPPPGRPDCRHRCRIWEGASYSATQVEAADAVVGEEGAAGAGEAVAAEFEDVAAVADGEGLDGVLLDQQQRHAGRFQLADLVEDQFDQA